MTDRNEPSFQVLIQSAASALKDRRDEVNKLNVFPVPDGDTGTNMSLTMDAVVAEIGKLDDDAPLADICHAVTHGSLMGARGNSGVILSQILRGLCEVVGQASEPDPQLVSDAFARSVIVAFQAVRKPIEGTMLTVLRDASEAAPASVAAGKDVGDVLKDVVDAAYASVRRTPDLLPVLKEAGVVDAGGFGLAILFEGFTTALEGGAVREFEGTISGAGAVLTGFTPIDDWDDQEYLYCTEFLVFGQDLDRESVEERLAAAGGSELVVGDSEALKIHVHTDDPASVLAYATGLGEVAEVHVNNMRRQTAARAQELRAGTKPGGAPVKPLGFVAVAAGQGLADILISLGVDCVVSGGQTMNPSTAELLAAVEAVPAESVVILPDNRNIILAAQATAGVATKPVGVVPTTSVPEAFSALLAFDPAATLDANVESMTRAASGVRTGEVTTAVRKSKGKAGRIKAGQVIGIADHEIEAVGNDVAEVAERLLDVIAGDGETLTLLAGEDMTDEQLQALAARLAERHPELEMETHRGGQPLYPLIMAVE
jgi:DAK2 domain fusion protein YloV